jgi:4'-phosphopantetheinyl transferase
MKKHNIHIHKITLIRPDNIFNATLCYGFFPCITDYEEALQSLYFEERNYFNTLQFEKRIRSYLIGRLVAKKAVSALIGEKNLKNIFIQSGIFGQPFVASNKQNIQISITHCNTVGAALAFPEAHPMGIDIEKITLKIIDIFKSQVTENESNQISSCPLSYEIGLTLLWTAKEALSKILKTGLMTPFEIFEISKIQFCDDYILCYYKNFTQYKVISFIINSYICSIAHPLKTEMDFDSYSFIKDHEC